MSDDLVEKKKGKKLAGEMRAGIEHAGAEGNVAVNIENQKLVTLDSGSVNGLSEFLVTSLTFPEFANSMAKKRAAEADLAAKNEADKVSKPEQITNNDVAVQQPSKDQLPVSACQEDEPKQQSAKVEEKPSHNDPIPKKKPCPLVLPLAKSHLNPNLPKSPSVPTSPGFSRNSSLANLGPQELRQTLKKYGPKKTALGRTP